MLRIWARGVAALQLSALLVPVAVGADASATAALPLAAQPQGEVLLDNLQVTVRKFVVAPGQSTVRHAHPGAHLLVYIRGGVLRSLATGRSTLWKDGRVVWQEERDRADAPGVNVGADAIEMVCVSLRSPAPLSTGPAKGAAPTFRHLNYPNIPGEDLLENDRVIVQRFTVNPGQWEGVHAHHPNMLYIHVKGGQWAARSSKEPEHLYPERSPDGEVGWMPTIDISEGHESGNVGGEPIDLIWVTLKQ